MFHVHVSCAEAFNDKKGVDHVVVICCNHIYDMSTQTGDWNCKQKSGFFQAEVQRISNMLWKGEHKQYQQPYSPSPLTSGLPCRTMLQGMVYISDTKGGVRALDMKDGKRPGVAAGMCIIDRTPNDLR